jgi:hypothetical protein
MSHVMVQAGRELRDNHLWQYPLLPGAVTIYQQMASSREWRVTGNARGVARAVEWLNNAQSYTYDGLVHYGLEQYLKRRVLDYLCIGRTMFTFKDGGPLLYLDPAYVTYQMDSLYWEDSLTSSRYDRESVFTDHPIPIGSMGGFMSPLLYVIPTAMLAWLVREHDRASADGRKIRDITVVIGSNLGEQVKEAIEETVALWNGGDVTKNGVPIVWAETSATGQVDASKLVTTFGLANIPDSFNRSDFQFEYVNEIGSALGLALRHFWNSEKATNRALEEVQEARQQQKGPASFVRTEERLLNNSGALKQFGAKTRFAFVEEVDIQSRQANAAVMKMHAEGLKIFAEVFNAEVNGEAFLAWLQGDGILPADLDLLTEVTRKNPDESPTPDGDIVAQDSNADTVRNQDKQKIESEKSIPEYDEVTIDQRGRIIERRAKVVSFEKVLELEILSQKKAEDVPQRVSFKEALASARTVLREKYAGMIWSLPEQIALAEKAEWSDEDYRTAKAYMDDDNYADAPVAKPSDRSKEPVAATSAVTVP